MHVDLVRDYVAFSGSPPLCLRRCLCLCVSLCLCLSKLCSCLLVSDVALSGSSPLCLRLKCHRLLDLERRNVKRAPNKKLLVLTQPFQRWRRDRPPSFRVTRLVVSDRTTKTFLADLSQPHLIMNRGHSTKIHRLACEESTPQNQFLPKSKIQQQFSAPEIRKL